MNDYYGFNDRKISLVFCHLKQDRELFSKIINKDDFRSETWRGIINSTEFPLTSGHKNVIMFNIDYSDGKYIQEFLDFINGNGWQIAMEADNGMNRAVYIKKL